MSAPNPYAYLVPIAMKYFRDQDAAERAARKPRLTLITKSQATTKGNHSMNKTNERDAKKAAIAELLRDAATEAAPAYPGPVYRKLSQLRLVDHVGMVHNALEAVRCLAIPSGTGISPGGCVESLDVLGRNHFVDLLEIINDRLGAALELDER